MADGSVEDILVARMTDAGHWKLSKNMAHKLIDRYGAERVSVNLSYAEQHQNSEYKHGSWLIHSIVTDMVNKYK